MKFLKTGPVNGEGTLVFDPELRYTPSGKAVANIQIAEGEDVIVQATAWEELAESIAEHCQRDMAVSYFGVWSIRHWTDREGLDHTVNYVLIHELHWG